MPFLNRLNRTLLFLFLFVNSVMLCPAQNMGRIAILSFNGGSRDEGDGIAELFSFTPEMKNFVIIPRTTITRAIETEQSFQYFSGMTDADTMARLGNQFGADYVMAGSITSLGRSNLLIVSIVKIDVIQQVAGDFITYNSLDDLIKNKTIIERMAANLVALMKKNTGNTDKLAVLPVQFSGDVNEQDGDALAQVLSIYLIRYGKYTVYPRTKALEQVQSEYTTQMSGKTRDNEAVSLGHGVNPPYVLSIASRKIGNTNRFNASVIDLERGNQIAGYTEPYTMLNDGIDAMDFLAQELSGLEISNRKRSKRSNHAASSANTYFKNSGLNFAAWLGPSESFVNHSTNPVGRHFSGGGEIELRLFRYLGLQTGFQIFQDEDYPFSEALITKTMMQVPVLARTELSFARDFALGLYFSPYIGIGINLFSPGNDIAVQSSPHLSLIAGGDIGFYILSLKIFIGYQYNQDLSDTTYSFCGESFSYSGKRSVLRVGISKFIPFRKTAAQK